MDESEVGPPTEDVDVPGEGGRGEPIVRGVVKIDWNDDDAISDLAKGIADEYEKAMEAAGFTLVPEGEFEVVSVGGVPYEEHLRIEKGIEAEYRLILSYLPSDKKPSPADFLAVVDAYIHRSLTACGEAWLYAIVENVQEALEWGDVDMSGINIRDGDEVWDIATVDETSYIDDEVGEVHIATLDLGRGETYVCADTHSERYVYDYEILAEVAPNDREALRDHGFE